MIKKSRITILLCFSFFIASQYALADSLSQAGIKVGMSYDEAKDIMLQNGWSVTEDKDEYSNKPYTAYPEISCGSGRHAVCSVGFNKGVKFIALTIESNNGALVISGEY